MAAFKVNLQPAIPFGSSTGGYSSEVQSYPFPDLGYHSNYDAAYIEHSLGGGSLTATNNFRGFTAGLKIKSANVFLQDLNGNFTAGSSFTAGNSWLNGREMYINFVKAEPFGDIVAINTDQSPVTVDGGQWNRVEVYTAAHYYPLVATGGSGSVSTSADRAPEFIRSGQGVTIKNCVSLDNEVEIEGATVTLLGITAAGAKVYFYGGDGIAYGSNGVPVANAGRIFNFIDSALTAQGAYSGIGYAGLTAPAEAGTLSVFNSCYSLQSLSGQQIFYSACDPEDVEAMRSVLDTGALGLGQQVVLKSSEGQTTKVIDKIVTNPLIGVDASGSALYEMLPINIAFAGNCTVGKLISNGAIVKSDEQISVDSVVRVNEMILNDNAILDFNNDNSLFDDWRFGSLSGSTINGGILLNSSSAQILGSEGVRLWNTQTKAGSAYNARSGTSNIPPTAVD